MVAITSLFAALGALSSVAFGQTDFKIQNWGNGEDTTNYTYTSLAAGRFKLSWDLGPGGNFVAGKGYAGDKNLVVNYTAKYKPTGNSYLALYGFSQNPFVEFYVMEDLAEHNPSDNTGQSFYGYHTSDDAQYELWSKYNGNLRQYWSVRRTNRKAGTITFNNHYNAWIAAGLPLGTLQNTFIVVEGQQGTGTADITVGVRPTRKPVETPTPTTRTAVCMTSPTLGPVCKAGAAKKRDGMVTVARAVAEPTP